ncbi:MAG TPA: acetate--CoA ligase family protein [Thermoplasmata archaeon]|nr:acetate--CoA ligase family protein [Thermoplasmata archaeon]
MADPGLDRIFAPKSIAVVGASRHEGKIGYEIVKNLVANGYRGSIYPINPKADEILDIRVYPSVGAVPGPVDLAVIVVPAALAIPAVEECGKKGVKGLVVITAGFREIGGPGLERERELLRLCKTYGMTMIGPNCMGVINTHPDVSMDATFAPTAPLRGHVSLVTQSGALGVAILEHTKSLGIGFAKFCSLGNKAQVSLNDLLQAWGEDPETKIIVAYIENFGNPKNFVRIAREVTKKKPVIAMKAGRSEAGGRATASHTGSLGGSDLAAEAVFSQTGVLRANSIEELFDYASAFSLGTLPKGNRVAVVSDAGGPAIMAVDELSAQGLILAEFTKATRDALASWAPPEASTANPIDLTPEGSLEDYRKALDAVLADETVDAAIAVYVPPVRTDEVEWARVVWTTAHKHHKPVLCNFLGRTEDSPGFLELVSHGLPSYLYPESAARSLAALYRYALYLKRDEGRTRTFEVSRAKAGAILDTVLGEGRTRLTEIESVEFLEAYGIQTARARLCRNIDDAAVVARQLGYPVVLKAIGKQLLHKTEQRAVVLDIRDERALRLEAMRLLHRMETQGIAFDGILVQEHVSRGKEVILGMTRDRVYGPFLVFGLGGIYVEYLKDVSFGLPPLTDQDAYRMIRSIRTYPLLAGVRGEPPRDIDALAEAILRLAQLVLDFDQIQEIDLNPLIALEAGKGYRAVDARILLTPPEPETA